MSRNEGAWGGAISPTFLLMAGRGVGFAATFFIPVVLARTFDQETFGTYRQLFLIFSTLYFIAQFGMAESLFYFVPEAKENAGRFVSNALVFLGVSGCLCGGLLHLTRGTVARWLHNPALATDLPLLGVFLVLMLASAQLEMALTARRRYFGASLSYGLSDLGRAVMFLVPAVVTRRLEALLLGGVLFAVIRLVATLRYFGREFPGSLRPDRALLRRQLAYALPFGAAVLVDIVQMNLHQYAVAWWFPATTFAVYSVGCLQIPIVDLVAGPAGNVLMVRMSESRAAADRDGLLRLWTETTGHLAAFFLPLTVGLLVLSRDLIVVLFTDRYAASVPIFMIWALSMLFAALQTDAVLRVFAQTRFLLLLNSVRMVLLLGTIGWFLSTFGPRGAVLVTLLGMLTAKILALGRIRALLRVDLRRLLPWRALGMNVLVAGTAAVPALLIRSASGVPLLPRLLLTGLTYATACLALRTLLPRWASASSGGPDERAVGDKRFPGVPLFGEAGRRSGEEGKA